MAGVWLGGGGVLSSVGDYILQEFITLYLARFRTDKISKLPNKNLEEKEASDRLPPAAKSLYM